MTPSTLQAPCIGRVRTKYTVAPSRENDGMESLPLLVICVAWPSDCTQTLPALA